MPDNVATTYDAETLDGDKARWEKVRSRLETELADKYENAIEPLAFLSFYERHARFEASDADPDLFQSCLPLLFSELRNEFYDLEGIVYGSQGLGLDGLPMHILRRFPAIDPAAPEYELLRDRFHLDADKRPRATYEEILKLVNELESLAGDHSIKHETIAGTEDDPYTDDVVLRSVITELSKTANIPGGKRAEFVRAVEGVVAAYKHNPAKQHSDPPLPAKAPELFKQRKDRSEDIPSFLRRVWSPWVLHGTLSRSDLRVRDLSAIRAVENWISDKPLPGDLKLPGKKEVNDKLLAENPAVLQTDPRLVLLQAGRVKRKAKGSQP